MNAKRLPSGNYRARAFDYEGSDGVKHYRSFTAPTKREAEQLANEFLMDKERHAKSDLTVREAILGYIKSKENVLSPSTIRGYMSMYEHDFSLIAEKRIAKLTTVDIQTFISDITKQFSAKTVSNVHGLLISALSLYMPNKTFKVTLPTHIKKRPAAPSDEDVKRLFHYADERMKICIALAAFGSMRRGEICGIKYSDLSNDTIYVHADVVKTANGEWIYKNIPKTSDSVRHVRLPKKIIKLLGSGEPDEYIVKYPSPDGVTSAFARLKRKAGVDIRFHDLRHYFASIGVALGVPDIYLSDFGGWRRGSSVLKDTYQNSIGSLSDQYSERMVQHFDDMI